MRGRLLCTISVVSLLGGGAGCGDDAEMDADSGGTLGEQTTTGVDTGADSMTSTTAGDTGADTTDTGAEPLPNGEQCADNEECESGLCFVVGAIGGICGNCISDADCEEGGCSIPNPLADPPKGAECNMGEQGGGCMSDEVCSDALVCVEILNVPGILVANTCSACNEDADCTDQLCSPSYDVLELSGSKSCVDPGSIPDGEGCDLISGTGDDACENFCAPASVMGLVDLGVCSACNDANPCADGLECEAPVVSLTDGLIAGACVTPR